MLRVKRLDPRAIVPTVEHPGTDLAFDLYALEDAVLHTGVPTKVRTGIAIEFTNEHMGGLIRDRSSMAAKGIITTGGVIDAGYRGEVIVLLTYTIPSSDSAGLFPAGLFPAAHKARAGDKIAQLIPVLSLTHMTVREVNDLTPAERGNKGFGSSGR